MRSKYDVRFTIEGYSGHADVYISPRDVPSGPNSSRVKMRANQGPQRSIVLTIAEREAAGFSTGTYNLCFYAYTPFSGLVTTIEYDFKGKYDIADGRMQTISVEANDYIQGRYSNTELR